MKRFCLTVLLSTVAFASAAVEPASQNAFTQHNFVASSKQYNPSFATDPKFINAWGISIRPAGAGGHFWVTAKDISYEYVGDVRASSNEKLRDFHQDGLKIVTLPVGGDDKFSTSTVFSGSKENFVITQDVKGADPITAPAKFFFSSDGGIISAWTERKKEDGSFDWPSTANNVIDQSKEGAQFFGLAISHGYDTLYAADFGAAPSIKVFDGKFQPKGVKFDQPFDTNKNGKVDAGEFAPFNIQGFTTPEGKNHIFVTYAKTQPCPAEEVKAKACKESEIFAGEEDTTAAGNGRLAEFTEDGKLVAVWKDGDRLLAPWGMAIAPKEGFGKLSGTLLVGNFGDGTIAAYDMKTREFVDVMRNEKGEPVVIDKIWGILFGNGNSLGDADALYFAAGPNDEKDGLFGSLRLMK